MTVDLRRVRRFVRGLTAKWSNNSTNPIGAKFERIILMQVKATVSRSHRTAKPTAMYEDRARKAISERNFAMLSAKYQEEQTQLENMKCELQAKLDKSTQDTDGTHRATVERADRQDRDSPIEER